MTEQPVTRVSGVQEVLPLLKKKLPLDLSSLLVKLSISLLCRLN